MLMPMKISLTVSFTRSLFSKNLEKRETERVSSQKELIINASQKQGQLKVFPHSTSYIKKIPEGRNQ